ncbi:RibD family protein [Thermophilibacter provencensis]|uniref:RibD family protein n=1 Tax=Thermophilibacter provencensis TaxID=1852386 RepID=UPI00094AE66A|nr:dihydrofolate reductase family protein [Thermophilibacter provencensis]
MSDKIKATDRPYVICHVFAGLNGRIDGAYMFDPAAAESRAEYSRMQRELGADAVAYGSVTTRGFVGGGVPALDAGASVPDGDFVAPHAERSFYVSIDPAGEITWTGATYRRPGRADAHVIEVLTNEASPAYRAHLREQGVSYVIAGRLALDLPLALRKLRGLFGIERVLVCGGGKTDMAFLAAGVLDELSLVLSPTVSGEPGTASVFDETPPVAEGSFAFRLADVERLPGDGLHLVYRVAR